MIDIPSMVYATVEEERKSTSLHPSAIDSCVLKEMFRISGKSITHPQAAESRWFLKRYGTYEEYFREAFSQHGILIAEQPEFKLGKWSGRADFIVQYPPRGGEPVHLVEVKSVNPGAIKNRRIPYKHHKKQVWVYYVMNELGDKGWNLDRFYLAYIERWDDGKVPRIEQFDVTPTEEEIELTKRLMARFDVASQMNGYPARPYESPEQHPWNCVSWNNNIRRKEIRCPYFDHCWPGQEMHYVDHDNGLPF